MSQKTTLCWRTAAKQRVIYFGTLCRDLESGSLHYSVHSEDESVVVFLALLLLQLPGPDVLVSRADTGLTKQGLAWFIKIVFLLQNVCGFSAFWGSFCSKFSSFSSFLKLSSAGFGVESFLISRERFDVSFIKLLIKFWDIFSLISLKDFSNLSFWL